MNTYYIIPSSLYSTTDWQASACCNVGPVAIVNGDYAGSYAINTSIFASDDAFEAYRSLLEDYPQATLTSAELTPNTQEN